MKSKIIGMSFLMSVSITQFSNAQGSDECPDFKNEQVFTCVDSTGEVNSETVKIKLREGVKSFKFETSLSPGFGYAYLFIPDGITRQDHTDARLVVDRHPYDYASYTSYQETTTCLNNTVRKQRSIGEKGTWIWISERGLDASGKLIRRELFEIRNSSNPEEILLSEDKKNICSPEGN